MVLLVSFEIKPERNQSNNKIEKKAIRRYFYLGSIITIILPTALLLSIYSSSLQKEYSHKVQQLTDSIMTEKKRFLRNAVDRTIYLIDFERKQAELENKNSNLSNEQIEAIAKERVIKLIRGLRLIDDGYVWINKIVNYEGGDNYGIRLVHPNLPKTEGVWLSTNTEDIQGNQPYKVELEGIKKNGEVFFEYYFKKLNTDVVSRKLSYAKLYSVYDWVIATGIYLDDVDRLIAQETLRMESSYEKQKVRFIIIAIAAIAGSLFITFVFEKLIQTLIRSYESKLDSYTRFLERLSTTDKLTGLFNRLKLDELLDSEFKRAHRYGTAFSVMLIDLDFFKQVNDRFGHQFGDTVLQETAAVLLKKVRSSDSVGRWGGEEFIVICPETHLDGAVRLAEGICAAVEAHIFSKDLNLTCSIGVGSFRENDSKEELINRADHALYLAKDAGRNQVRTESETPGCEVLT